MPFRFVHTADLHLDSPLRSLAMRNGDLAELIGDATRQALVSIVDLCITEQVDALIIAGDLYDGDQTSMKTARFLASQMQRMHEASIATFIIRGNHDALSRITHELILPPSVTVFGGRSHAVDITHGDLALSIHGLSFAKPHAPESLLEKYHRPAPDAINIGIMYTSVAGAPGHDLYAPCKASDLHGWGFDYWALGHIHARAQHAGDRMVIMPGMPQGRTSTRVVRRRSRSLRSTTIGASPSKNARRALLSSNAFRTSCRPPPADRCHASIMAAEPRSGSADGRNRTAHRGVGQELDRKN